MNILEPIDGYDHLCLFLCIFVFCDWWLDWYEFVFGGVRFLAMFVYISVVSFGFVFCVFLWLL